MKQPKFYWHIQDDILLEPLVEPLKHRIEFIQTYAPENEIKLRLKLIKPVIGNLPKELVKVGQEKCQQWQKVKKVEWKHCVRINTEEEQDYDRAEQRYNTILRKYLPQLKILHEKECGCGYDFNKETIFTKKNGFKK